MNIPDFNRKPLVKIIGGAVVAVLVAACGATPRMEIPIVEQPVPLKVGDTEELEPIIFAKSVVTLRRGTVIGHYPSSGYSSNQIGICNHKYPNDSTITWRQGGRTSTGGMDGELASAFHETMTAAGYNVKGRPDILFDRQDEFLGATFRVGARIVDIKSNICDLYSIWDGAPMFKAYGEMYMKVEWSVYSNRQKLTIGRFTTTGVTEQKMAIKGVLGVLFIGAFDFATEALAANPEFLKLVSPAARGEPLAEEKLEVALLSIKRVRRLRRKFPEISDHLTNATVTVRGGLGHGSGFVISKRGYVLTNQHVVGSAKKVQIIFRSGIEVEGRVLRRHKTRDIALIQLNVGGLKPLAIRAEPLKVAEPVYAIGSPLREDMRATVTKGIVSALRTNEESGLPIIQADVDIAGGNSGGPLLDENGSVVGITVSGYRLSSGLNYFIPINSALKALNIAVEVQK